MVGLSSVPALLSIEVEETVGETQVFTFHRGLSTGCGKDTGSVTDAVTVVPMGGENNDPVPREQPALKLVLGLVLSPNEKTTVLSTALGKRVEVTQLEILVGLFIPTPFLVLLRDSFNLLGSFMLLTENNARSQYRAKKRSREAQIVTTTGLF